MQGAQASTAFAVSFLIGVAGAVYIIIRGVERRHRAQTSVDQFGRETGGGRISLRVPLLSAMLIVFGTIGYLLHGLASLELLPAAFWAALAAAAAGPIAARRVRQWANRAASTVSDDRYTLQGHIARVVSAADGEVGTIEYTINGRRVVAPATAVDRSALVAGADVVIDRLEDGIVYVEPWTRVEERI